MKISFKRRIALRFMLATAIIIAVVFATVYFIVQQTVYQNLDNDLSFEAEKHLDEVAISEHEIHFLNKGEWEEEEHREVEVNPVFIQIVNAKGELMDKSPNLKEAQLEFKPKDAYNGHFNTELNGRIIRQIQIPLLENGEVKGYIVSAMSLDSMLMVLNNLRNTLFVLYPLILIVLFFISSYLAGKSITPVITVIETTNRISKNNLSERVELPQNKDVLYDLSHSINNLLDRIEDAIKREKQFTSDASHELRTPIAVLRGTLEVLIRKPRTQKEYEEKIKYSLTEIDRMGDMVEQLLFIARLDNPNIENKHSRTANISTVIQTILQRYKNQIIEKKLKIEFHTTPNSTHLIDEFYGNLILENIINNAIKYANDNTTITIDTALKNDNIICTVKDQGIGIKDADLKNIYTPFFRSESLTHKNIKGTGLGLSIAQKSANKINATIKITSVLNKGTTVTINFKRVLRK